MNIKKNKAQLIDITYALKSYNDTKNDKSEKAIGFKGAFLTSISKHHGWILNNINREVIERVLFGYFNGLYKEIDNALCTGNPNCKIDYTQAQEAIEKYIDVLEPFIRSIQCDAFETLMDKEQGVVDGNEDEKKAS
jgi:hypothetical protein